MRTPASAHTYYGVPLRDKQNGVPYPGTFLLDENGVITARYFEQSYRVRPIAALFREIALGSPGDHPLAVAHAHADLQLTAWADMSAYRPYQQERLHIHVDLPTGTHIFASPVPDGYSPLHVEIESLDGLTVGAPEVPTPTQRLRVPGVDDELLVYTDSVRVSVPIADHEEPGGDQPSDSGHVSGLRRNRCYPPRSARLTVTLEGLDLIRD